MNTKFLSRVLTVTTAIARNHPCECENLTPQVNPAIRFTLASSSLAGGRSRRHGTAYFADIYPGAQLTKKIVNPKVSPDEKGKLRVNQFVVNHLLSNLPAYFCSFGS